MSFRVDPDSSWQKLRGGYLAAVFDDTSTSYKLFWFRALIEILKRRWNSGLLLPCEPIPVSELLAEMLTAAWHPVCFFKLSLGRTDKLQNACELLRSCSGLAPNAKLNQIRSYIAGNPEVLDDLRNLVTYVPALFLTPWFADEMRGISAGTDRVKKATQLAFDSRNGASAALYWLEGRGKDLSIIMENEWVLFLYQNIGLIEDFSDHHLCDYLQSRNPSAPAIIHKLRMPFGRRLGRARSFWTHVKNALDLAGKSEVFQDIYTGNRLEEVFALDHFLPWSFLAHDQLWNLTPVSRDTNSNKGDKLPDLDCYLPRLVTLQWNALKMTLNKRMFHDDYITSFKDDIEVLVEKGEASLLTHYRELMIPQNQLAVNQGFVGGWRFSA
jgi:hypothetical protein